MSFIWKKCRQVILIELFFHILYMLTECLFPLIHKYLFDHIKSISVDMLLALAVIYVLGILLDGLFQYISQFYEWKLAQQFFLIAKQELFEHLTTLPEEQFNEKAPAGYVSLFNNDLEVIDENYIDPVVDIIKSSFSLLICFVSLVIFVDLRVAVTIVLASIVAVAVPKLIGQELSQRRKKFLGSLGSYNGTLTDFLVAKYRVTEETFKPFAKSHFRQLVQTEDSRLQFGKCNTLANILNGTVMFFIQMLAFVMVAYLVMKREISMGAAVATFSYVENFVNPIKELLIDLNLIHSTKDTVKTLEDRYLNSPLPKERPFGGQLLARLKLVGVKGVTKNQVPVDLPLKAGGKYALLGRSGIGKSVFLSHVGLAHIELKTKEGKVIAHPEDYVFYLHQQEHLYQTDFHNNVTLFSTYSDGLNRAKELMQGLTASQRKNLKTHEVKHLSGGERNLLAILRALSSDKPILLLDEPTAALDKATTRLVLDYLLALKETTIVMILHEEDPEILAQFDQQIIFDEQGIQVH